MNIKRWRQVQYRYNNMSATTDQRQLNDKWVLYHHLPSEKNWTLSGYTVLSNDISTVNSVIAVKNYLPENMIKYSMLFLMRHGISPLWEDPKNRNGGCFSYKIFNKHVEQVWRDLMCTLCGETLCDAKFCSYINGITISPKKNFCIVKIWMSTKEFQDPNIIRPVENLTKHGSVFKSHSES
jgi:hypothetical protein